MDGVGGFNKSGRGFPSDQSDILPIFWIYHNILILALSFTA